MSISAIIPEFILNSFMFKLFMASLLGAIIGFERDIHGRAAGLRTNLLVSLGAAVFMILSEYIALVHADPAINPLLRADPSRIAAQIITGIGFLGAGAIIKHGLSIRGLTTAACLWISAAIGMSVGAGFYDLALITTIISIFSLVILNKFESVYFKDSYRLLELTMSIDADLSKVITLIKRDRVKILFLDKEKDYEKNLMMVTFTLKLNHKKVTDKLSHDIVSDIENADVGLHKVKWFHQ